MNELDICSAVFWPKLQYTHGVRTAVSGSRDLHDLGLGQRRVERGVDVPVHGLAVEVHPGLGVGGGRLRAPAAGVEAAHAADHEEQAAGHPQPQAQRHRQHQLPQVRLGNIVVLHIK